MQEQLPIILSIDTSCDETAVAVTQGRRVLSNVIYSQILLHKEWGGVVPSIAKRAHEERIDFVVESALKKFVKKGFTSIEDAMKHIDYVAVTQGPGLAIALEVGIRKAKELAKTYEKNLIAVNHMEGHLYSPFVQNSKGNPELEMKFPIIGLLVSGAHTELVLWKDHLSYELLGETVDDAAGEALDKAARLLLGVGYPGGGAIERLSKTVKNRDIFKFPRPMSQTKDLQFSFSGLKTALLYKVKGMSEQERNNNLADLTSSYQRAVVDSLLIKLERAMQQTKCNRVSAGGGVIANSLLRVEMRRLVKKYHGEVFFPHYKYLTSDNAAMIGVVAGYRALKEEFVKDFDALDRVPRLQLG